MSRSRPRDARRDLDLRRSLRGQMTPLAILLVVVVAAGAPVSAFVLGLEALRARGARAAEDLAAELAWEAARRPRLWQYDSLKVLDHIRSYEAQSDVAQILVLDERARSVDTLGSAQPLQSPSTGLVVWEGAPIALGEARFGYVWIAMAQAPVIRSSLPCSSHAWRSARCWLPSSWASRRATPAA